MTKSSKTISQLFNDINIFEIVFTCVCSVALGVAFWGWTLAYDLTKPFLKILGLNYLMAGFWIFSSVFVSLIVRRPLIAIVASIIAAGVQGVITHWGAMALVWGLVQGLGAETVFFATRYRSWSFKTILLAAATSASFSYLLDYYYYGYYQNAQFIRLTQYISFVISSLVFAGGLSYVIVRRLQKLNLLRRFLSA